MEYNVKHLQIEPRDIMTPTEVADYLRVSTRHIYNWARKEGGIPSFRVGTLPRFSRKAIDEWKNKQ